MKTPRQTALDLLARREHSADELFRKLKLRKFDLNEIQHTVQQLQQEGLLSNARFVENYIHARRNKGMGPVRIHAELIERGISQDLIDQGLDMADNAWLAEARKVWQKRFKKQKPTDFKVRAQQMRFLQYRGFTREQIEQVFESYEDHD